MMLYHGTNQLIGNIDLSKGRNRTDFGLGFYLSDKIGTAQSWAISKTMLLGGTPTVIQYEINDDYKELYGHRFNEIPSEEWLDFVVSNRKPNEKGIEIKEPRHDYNWVSGPIADDKMNDVVKVYIAGSISREEAIRRARILPRTFQVSIHTTKAIKCINENDVLFKQLKTENGQESG